MVNRSRGHRLYEPLAQAGLQTGAVGSDVCGLDDVVGFDYHRGDFIARDFVLCAAR